MMILCYRFHKHTYNILQLITACLLISVSGIFNQIYASKNPAFSFVADTIKTDTIKRSLSNELKSKVIYNSYDSILFDVVQHKVYLYYNASIKYEDITLNADYIEIDWETKTMYATGLMNDSAKKIIGEPVFTQNDEKFTSSTIRYNFGSKRGKISQVITQQGDGYIHGDTILKTANDNFYIKTGKYTTCEDTHPHFYIGAEKLKIIKNNKIITGPAYLVIEDVPTPLAIPFGFFPNKKGRSSGIVIPKYGESAQLGFFLREGGFYFGVNDNFDLLLTGDIYSFGSWGAGFQSRYVNKYHYTGTLNLEFSKLKNSERELPDYSLRKDFFIRWSHQQDPKARGNSNFSGSVNAGTSTNFRNKVTASDNFLQSVFNSSVSYNTWSKNNRFNFSAAARHSQNSLTRAIEISLPQMSFSMAALYPFLRKNNPGRSAWYEKINIGYSSNAINSVNTFDTLLFKNETLDKIRYGVSHSVPLSASFRVFKYFNLTPSASYTQNWHFSTIRKNWNSTINKVETDTVKEFRISNDYSAGASLGTRIFGTAMFRKGKIAGIRHTISPNVAFNYRPDYSQPRFKYYNEYQSDSAGSISKYSIFENGVYSGPSSGKYGFISFGADNNVELKMRQTTDTAVNFKKVKLLESLSFSSGYNMSVKTFNWSVVNVNARSTILQFVNVFGACSFDPYAIDTLGKRINRFEYNVNKKLLRFTQANGSISFSMNNQTFKKKKEETDETKKKAPELDYIPVIWNFSVGYNIQYSKNITKDFITQTVNFSGDLKLTPTWSVTYNSGYDFQTNDFSYTSLGFKKDLHCWEMSFDWVPLGPQTFYFFQINVKSSTLRDLKITKQRDRFN